MTAGVRYQGPATPLEPAPASLAGDRDLWLKREDVHELGSFKWRGALPALERFQAEGARGVVTASTGNHGAATAWAAQRLGLGAVIFVPEGASATKLAFVRSCGAEVREEGHDLDDAKERALAYAETGGLPFFEDGAERAQYEGYRSIAAEILEQLDEPPAAVVAPVGNGALLGGLGLELCERCPGVERIGVASAAAPVMVESWVEGRPISSDRSETFADGLAVRVAIPFAVSVLGEVASRMLTVSERAIAQAVGAYASIGIRAEGAAGAALAALDELEPFGGAVIVVVTGRNIDDVLHRRATEAPETFSD